MPKMPVKETYKINLTIRSFKDNPNKVYVWVLKKEGPAISSLMSGEMLPEHAERLAEVFMKSDIVVHREERSQSK